MQDPAIFWEKMSTNLQFSVPVQKDLLNQDNQSEMHGSYGFIMKTHLKIPIVQNVFLQYTVLSCTVLYWVQSPRSNVVDPNSGLSSSSLPLDEDTSANASPLQ